MEIKEDIISMADDWEDVSDQFELINSFTLKELDKTSINVENAGIIFSKKLSIIFFSKRIFLCSVNDIHNDNDWHGGLSLKSNSRFYDKRDSSIIDAYKMDISNFVFPSNVNRGITLHTMFHLSSPNISTTNWLGLILYTGPANPNGISVKIMIDSSGISPKAFELTGLCFYATERQ